MQLKYQNCLNDSPVQHLTSKFYYHHVAKADIQTLKYNSIGIVILIQPDSTNPLLSKYVNILY